MCVVGDLYQVGLSVLDDLYQIHITAPVTMLDLVLVRNYSTVAVLCPTIIILTIDIRAFQSCLTAMYKKIYY